MIKLIIVGLVGTAAALGGSYFGYDLILAKHSDGENEEGKEQLSQISSELTGVPIVEGNVVVGYVVLRVSSLVDASKLPTKEFDVNPFVADAAFKATYAFAEHGFNRIRPADLEKLSSDIMVMTNQRVGADAVKSVSLEQYNFVKKSEIRGMLQESK